MIEQLDEPGEIVFVDDRSTDGSFDILVSFHERDPRLKVVRLSRNFGHQIAITAGLDHARGQAAVIMDADLQDPPEVALDLARRWREGYDVVYAVRERAGETRVKLLTAKWFYRVIGRMTEVDVPARRGLPSRRPTRLRCDRADARAPSLPARDVRVGRLQPDRRPLHAVRRYAGRRSSQ